MDPAQKLVSFGSDDDKEVSHTAKPNTWHLYRRHYENYTLRFTATPWLPYVAYVKDERGRDLLWGVTGSLVSNITESLGLRYTAKIPQDLQWGYRRLNGSWAGMLGDLHRNESEFAVGPFVITAMTSATFPPGYIYHYDPFQFLAGIEQPFATEIFTKVSTFDIQMWLLMFVYLVLLTSISLRLLSVGSVRPQKLGCLEKLNRWNDMFFLYFSGLIQRASSHRTHANNVAFRVLLCMWLVCAFFVMNFFTANMSASMMVKTEAPRIRTVADVLRTPNKRILLFADSGFTDLLMYSEVQSYRAVYGQILRTGGEVIPKEVFTERNMHRLLKQDAVILQEGHSLLYQVSQKCRSLAGHGVFYLSEELLASLILSWYTRPDFDPVLRHEIDVRAMWSVEHGLLESYVREVLSGGEDCFLRMSDKSDMEHRTLVFEDLRPMFLLALLLLQLATIVFIAEILIGTLTQMPRRHRRYL